MNRYFFPVFLISTLLITACSSVISFSPEADLSQAEILRQQGHAQEAATLYQSLAENNPVSRIDYLLSAADTLVKANQIPQAKQVLDKIFPMSQIHQLQLLYAEIDLNVGNPESALARLKSVAVEGLNETAKADYYQASAFATSLTGDFLQSAKALISLCQYTHSETKLQSINEDILKTLNSLPETTLRTPQTNAEVLNGWMALAILLKADETDLQTNLAHWKTSYPQHPANSAFLESYLKTHYRSIAQANTIAVFLPESGAFAEVAKVIKDGFMSAYNAAKKNGATQELRFYDTTKANAAELYQLAIKEGAQLCIGPLDKKDIKFLITNTELTVPVLALNHVEGLTHPKLYQFGLSPIDDAQQITLRARHDGHQNALLLVPKTEQGKRYTSYLTDNWQAVGGKIANVQLYNENQRSFTQVANEILTKNPIPVATNPITPNLTTTQVTETADVILMNAYPKPARLLTPALQNNTATSVLPVYATSQVYAGSEDMTQDKTLKGITFCDVPWMFDTAYAGELSKLNLRNTWQTLPASYLRLLPLGIDAYNVLAHLTELKRKPYLGATGRLTLDAHNKINRELFCAKFNEEGIPTTLNFATENSVPESPAAVFEEPIVNKLPLR